MFMLHFQLLTYRMSMGGIHHTDRSRKNPRDTQVDFVHWHPFDRDGFPN